MGISEENIPKLFVDFNKLEETEDINPNGTGLGLSICKQIIEEMGGSVKCSSQVNIGTIFKMRFQTFSKLPKIQNAFKRIISQK